MKPEPTPIILSKDGRFYSYYRSDVPTPEGWVVSNMTQQEAGAKGRVYEPFPPYQGKREVYQ